MDVKKIIIKILIILLIFNILILPKAYASSLGDMIQQGRDFLKEGSTIEDTIDKGTLKSTSSFIYKTLLAVAIVVSLIIGAVLGIQFIFASVEGKAKISEALVPYVVGCFIVFGAFTIWSTVVNFGNKTEGVESAPTALSGYICKFCSASVNIPGGVITGGRDYNCEYCKERIVKGGVITGAMKNN